MGSTLTFAVGDVHGCADKLRRLVHRCEGHAAGQPARYVFLGDYIDRGPDSRAVIDFLIGLQHAHAGAVVCLMGNHEQMALAAHESASAVPLWLANSGAATLHSYGAGASRIAAAHLDWMRGLPLWHDDGLRFFVHAGIDLARPLERQAAEVLLWMR